MHHALTALSALLVLSAPAMAQDIPQPVDTALAQAEETPDLRVSFTMRFEWSGEPAVVERYDAASRDWTVLEGDPRALPSEARTRLRNVKRSESKPGGLLYADFRDHLDEVRLAEETDDFFVYRFLPPEASGQDIPEGADGSFRARLYVSKDDDRLARYEARALETVSPLPATRLDEFVLEQYFERLEENGPAVLVRLHSVQRGRRVMQTLNTEFTATFSDFEVVQ